jgi:hypothetical protein
MENAKIHPIPRYQSIMPVELSNSKPTPHPIYTHSTTHQSSLLHIRRRKRLNHTRTIHKSRPENPVRIRKHAILQTDNNELTSAEASADQAANVLRVREIERGVHFVENVHGSRGVLEQR